MHTHTLGQDERCGVSGHCSCTHIHWGRMRGVGRLDIDCSCTHINWGGCMNREDVLFRRGCDSLRKEHYITKEEGEYLKRER